MNVHKHQQQSPNMAAGSDIRGLTLSREAFDKEEGMGGGKKQLSSPRKYIRREIQFHS